MISAESQQLLTTYGVPTGSYVFGGFNSKSDIDILLLDSVLDSHSLTSKHGFYLKSGDYDDQDFNCLYGRSSTNHLINVLLFTNDVEYDVNVRSTEILVEMLKEDETLQEVILNKQARCELFESLKSFYRIKEKYIGN